MAPPECSGHGTFQTLYADWGAKDSGHVYNKYPPHMCSIVPWTLLTICKFKDIIINNFKIVTAYH